eukprot:4071252-Prymnesium_polylepis.1
MTPEKARGGLGSKRRTKLGHARDDSEFQAAMTSAKAKEGLGQVSMAVLPRFRLSHTLCPLSLINAAYTLWRAHCRVLPSAAACSVAQGVRDRRRQRPDAEGQLLGERRVEGGDVTGEGQGGA